MSMEVAEGVVTILERKQSRCMTDDKEQEPAERLPKRRDDSEKAIGLEMARLFGMNPKLMMAPKQAPQKPAEPPESTDDEGEGDGESGA